MTNNISFECPSQWFQNARRTALQLFQGLSRNLFLKSVFFTGKVVWQSLIEPHSWVWDILKPTSRAKKWGIISSCSYLSQILCKAKWRKGWVKTNAVQSIWVYCKIDVFNDWYFSIWWLKLRLTLRLTFRLT